MIIETPFGYHKIKIDIYARISHHRHFIDICDSEGIDVAHSIYEILVLELLIAVARKNLIIVTPDKALDEDNF